MNDNFNYEEYSNQKNKDLSHSNNNLNRKPKDENKNQKLNKKNIVISILLIVVIIALVSVFLYSKFGNKEVQESLTGNKDNNQNQEIEKEPEKKVQIVDLDDTRRPYAIMINNHHAAWPQSGLKDAFIIYELMVEGGITRMMALFTQDKDVSKLGSVRSARHNYLDYALENDAIFVHFGGSTYAYDDIKKLAINNIDGNTFAGSYFYRDKTLNRSTEHTVFTTSDNIKKAITDLKYRTERNKDYLLNYTTDEVDLSKISGSQIANNVSVKYSYYQTSSYEYNPTEKVYYRSMSGQKHVDLVTGEQYKFKNILVYSVKYTSISKSDHQDLSNVGSGEGYYITNGYAAPITWSKASRSAETIYKYQDGSEISVSDGNTFIQIYPTTGSLSIS